MSTIADRIRQARHASEHTQMSLAIKLGVGLETVCRWEQGRATPRAESLVPLAAALEVEVSWLLSGETPQP